MSLRRNLALSFLIHTLLVCILLLFRHYFPARVADHKDWTWIELEPPVRTASKVKKDDTTKNQRIVQTDLGQKADQAAPDAFLGERTQTVDRQSVSKNSDLGKVGSRTQGGQAVVVPQSQGAESKNKSDFKRDTRHMDLSKFGVPILPPTGDHAEFPPREVQRQTALGEGEQSGEVAPHEYIKGLRTGDQTLLNTKEFVFYSYFQRIRERLETHWGSILRASLGQMYNNGRGLASDSEHITRVMVTLNSDGEIVRVQLMEESGVKDLDDAAVRAFNSAGPFPNPPKGIIDRDGRVQLRWDFVLRT